MAKVLESSELLEIGEYAIVNDGLHLTGDLLGQQHAMPTTLRREVGDFQKILSKIFARYREARDRRVKDSDWKDQPQLVATLMKRALATRKREAARSKTGKKRKATHG
jgi:hypothetical protein